MWWPAHNYNTACLHVHISHPSNPSTGHAYSPVSAELRGDLVCGAELWLRSRSCSPELVLQAVSTSRLPATHTPTSRGSREIQTSCRFFVKLAPWTMPRPQVSRTLAFDFILPDTLLSCVLHDLAVTLNVFSVFPVFSVTCRVPCVL
jgi:hypothetical protein